jgi:hypothetical protein
MKSNCRNSKFLESLKAIGCDVDKLNSLPADRELPKKLLRFVSGGKTGFTRTKDYSSGEFVRENFVRVYHNNSPSI